VVDEAMAITSPSPTNADAARAIACLLSRESPSRVSKEPSSLAPRLRAPPRTRRSSDRRSKLSRSFRTVTVETPNWDARSLTTTRPVDRRVDRMDCSRENSSREPKDHLSWTWWWRGSRRNARTAARGAEGST
jgi:hypothetical protein